MAFTYASLIDDLRSTTRNQTDSVTALRTKINTAVREWASEYDSNSLLRKQRTALALYDDVNRIPLPSDMKPEAVVDLHKSKNFLQARYGRYRKVTPNTFRVMRELDTLAFEYDTGLKWLIGDFSTTVQRVVLHDMNSLTTNGTWAAADNGENVALNSVNYLTGSASVEVDLAAAGTVVSIENSTITQVDLSNISQLFVWVYLPTKSNLTFITLLYGVDNANYYNTSATSPYNVDSFQTGWNLVAFDLGTLNGAVDLTAIDYLKLSITFSSTPSTLEGFLFENVMAAKGEPADLTYYSAYPWVDTSGVWKENSTSNQDTLNATAEEYKVILAKCHLALAKAIPMDGNDIQLAMKEHVEKFTEYARMFPSRRIKERNMYYRGGGRTGKRLRNVPRLGPVSESL